MSRKNYTTQSNNGNDNNKMKHKFNIPSSSVPSSYIASQ